MAEFPKPDPLDQVFCRCAKCTKEFELKWDRYGDPTPQSLDIRSCESAGVYGVTVKCPHCGHEHEIT